VSTGQSTDNRGQWPARLVVALLPLACLAYGVTALAGRGAWLSALAAAVVAVLLWRRHPRARFAAYVFFSALALRAVLTGAWPTLAFAVAAVLLLQTRAARTVWPRLAPGRIRGDKMPGP
jgi:hypothetical protein